MEHDGTYSGYVKTPERKFRGKHKARTKGAFGAAGNLRKQTNRKRR